MSNTLGAWCDSSDEASLYGRLSGMTWSTPSSACSPSPRTAAASPIAATAIWDAPGTTFGCTVPVASSRATTWRICSGLASGAIMIIIGRALLAG